MTALRAAAPRDLAALKDVLAAAAGPVTYIAGGTDLLVAPRRLPDDGLLIDISQLREFCQIEMAEGELRIGGACSIAALTRSPAIRELFPALARAGEQCGSAQIRNRATIGGNVVNASPAADLLPVLKCVDTSFEIMGRDLRRRQLGFNDLIRGSASIALGKGDLIIAISVPLQGLLPCGGFVKLGRREEMTISRLNLAMQAEYREDLRQLGEVRLVAGAIGPVPQRLSGVEHVLCGNTLSASTVRAFLDALVDAVDHAIPGRASQGYKRRAIMGLGLNLLDQVTGILAVDTSIEDAVA